MGFKCRLFGHTYGNPEVERSRKEEGDEVVVTIRNVKRCDRCGDEKMVNQTKEVTSVRSPEEVGLDAAEETPATPEPADETDAGPGAAAPTDDESPVTPVDPEPTPTAAETAEIDDAVDATVGGDAEPTPDTAVEPAADGTDDGVTAAPDENGTETAPDDSSETDNGWDEDAVVEDPDASTIDPAEDTPAPDGTDEPGASTAEAAAESDDGWETGSDDWDDVDPDPDADDAVILDAAETEHDEVQWPEEPEADPGPAADADDPTSADPTAPEADDEQTADAEIIDAGEPEADPAGGSTGEWPDHEDTGAAGGWPEHDTDDEGYSATPNGDVEAEFGGNGLTPEVNGGAPDESAEVDGITVGGADGHAAERTRASVDGDAADGDDSGTGQGFVRAGESTAEPEVPADRVEFYCPNCGYAQTAGTSSMRAGDICPECKQGYIAERER